MSDALAFFPGFRAERVVVDDGVAIHAVIGGAGPPLLMLHGAPQNCVMWRKIAPALAERFTVVCADLRGYGWSDKPAASAPEVYSKRRMGADQVALMRALGHPKFRLAGHDRGARTARRLAKDHPEAVEKLAILDIVPTAHIYSNVSKAVATNLWHWFFLIQPAPGPEALMGARAELFVRGACRLAGDDSAATDAMVATNATPEAFHAMCGDYRAGAGIDLEHDAADAKTPLAMPTLVLWGEASPSTGALFDAPASWAGEARDVAFASIACGHFLPEEKPAETLAALQAFL